MSELICGVKELLPSYVRKHYPYNSNYMIDDTGLRQHFIDEGKGEAIVMVHGNPTWSFFYRKLIDDLKNDYRVIVPDHIGCGLSDKPQDYPYTLSQHIHNLKQLISTLDLKDVTLVVHDWGGAIGLGYGCQHPQLIKKLVILNTAAFRSKRAPLRIKLCRTPLFGEWMIRGLNVFSLGATYMAVRQSMPSDIRKAFSYPYGSYADRIATARFVQDIPLKESHPSYPTLLQIEQSLSKIQCPKAILWGAKDFCFTPHFFHRWQEIYPDAETALFNHAGHYLLEDAGEDVSQAVKRFMEKNTS